LPVFIAATNALPAVGSAAVQDSFGVPFVRDSLLPFSAGGDGSGVATAKLLVSLLKDWGEGTKEWSRALGLADPTELLRFLQQLAAPAPGQPNTNIEDESEAASDTAFSTELTGPGSPATHGQVEIGPRILLGTSPSGACR
jgi:hypothetical protein